MQYYTRYQQLVKLFSMFRWIIWASFQTSGHRNAYNRCSQPGRSRVADVSHCIDNMPKVQRMCIMHAVNVIQSCIFIIHARRHCIFKDKRNLEICVVVNVFASVIGGENLAKLSTNYHVLWIFYHILNYIPLLNSYSLIEFKLENQRLVETKG